MTSVVPRPQSHTCLGMQPGGTRQGKDYSASTHSGKRTKEDRVKGRGTDKTARVRGAVGLTPVHTQQLTQRPGACEELTSGSLRHNGTQITVIQLYTPLPEAACTNAGNGVASSHFVTHPNHLVTRKKLHIHATCTQAHGYPCIAGFSGKVVSAKWQADKLGPKTWG